MSEDKYKTELTKALADFTAKVESAKGDYHNKIDKILQKIDDKKISRLKRKLNI